MPARGYPIDIDALILFELARGAGTAPEVLRRVRGRMKENGYKLNYGSWYPAVARLERKELVSSAMLEAPLRRGRARRAKIHALTGKGETEAKRLSAIIRSLLIPSEACA